MSAKLALRLPLFLAVALAFRFTTCEAQTNAISPREGTFADIATLAERADLVARVQITNVSPVGSARSTQIEKGFARFYVEGKTRALLVGKAPLGEKVRYLVDLPLGTNGRAPDLAGRNAFVFARRVPGRPEDLQLVTPTAQLPWSSAGAARLRGLLRSMVANDAPPRITGVREIIYVPGPLAGQGRTQIFLDTEDGSAASITVRHMPGAPVTWSASFSELAASGTQPVPRNTLAWYRLACFLPGKPPAVNLSSTEQARWQALDDYHDLVESLRPCARFLT